jgi:hypothetical protein
MSASSLHSSLSTDGFDFDDKPLMPLVAASWNVSAVNNNPFEYWVTYPDPTYNALMQGVQDFIDDPEQDVAVAEIFTDVMFDELCRELDDQNIAGRAELENFWAQDYRSRKAVAGFLKNPEIGVKRLASLPDRITNTIYLAGGGVRLRPTVINAYDVPMPSRQAWWVQWRDFMFRTAVQVRAAPPRSPRGAARPPRRAARPPRRGRARRSRPGLTASRRPGRSSPAGGRRTVTHLTRA